MIDSRHASVATARGRPAECDTYDVCRCRTPKGRGGWSPCHDGHGREPAPNSQGNMINSGNAFPRDIKTVDIQYKSRRLD